MKNMTDNSLAPALLRGLKVLELLASEDTELNLKSLSKRLEIPTPSLWRILNVLRENGYAIFDAETKTYRLGFKFLYMGNVVMNRMGFRSQARNHLKRLMDLSGETAELSSRVKDQLILIDQVEGPEAVRLFSRIGSAYPYFHATAPGKLYLAHMDGEKFNRVMDRMGLPKITDYTLTDLQTLASHLERVRKEGYAFDHQEMRIGVSRVAAPVYDRGGKIMACLGIAGPSYRVTPKIHPKLGELAKKVANDLSEELEQL